LSNLLRSTKWGHEAIEAYLWAKAERRIEALEAQGKTVLVAWDESVWEKPGSPAAEDLGLVRSAQADRLVRSRVGNFKTTGGRAIVVPGMQWLTLLVLGFKGAPLVAGMQWWTTQGKHATRRRSEMGDWLWRCAQAWGQRVLHIWDRGFAGHRWLQHALELDVRFLVRWRSGYHLVDAKGRRPAWHISRGKRSLDHRLIWDSRRRCWRKTGIFYTCVSLPDHEMPLWLVVSRPGKGRKPWYLLTNVPIISLDDAWQLVFAYARRWQVEMTYRYAKTELAMQSPRLWSWHNRLKLLFMVTLVYDFLLSLLNSDFNALRQWLLRHWCHRTGKRYRSAAIPLYRLRSALSRLWLAFPSSPLPSWENLG
jgi:hypothetical protein